MTDYHAYFDQYINLTEGDTVLKALSHSSSVCIPFFQNIQEEAGNQRYKPEKWTVKQVLAHVVDTERIFSYRALRFSRGDVTDLPGYDEKLFAENAGVDARPVADIVAEFELVRSSSVALFESMTPDMLNLSGTANGMAIDVRALGYLMAGHAIHHKNIVQERYGIDE